MLPQRPLWTVGFAAAFVLMAMVGRATIPALTDVALVWPAGGVAVLWLLLTRAGPASIDVGVLAVMAFTVNYGTGAPVDLSLVLMATNVVQAVVATEVLRRVCPRLWGCGGVEPLESSGALARMLVALTAATGVGTLTGYTGYLLVVGDMSGPDFLLWLGRNLCGLLVVTTFGLLWGQWLDERRNPDLPRRVPDPSAGGVPELVAAVALTVGLFVLAFEYDGVR